MSGLDDPEFLKSFVDQVVSGLRGSSSNVDESRLTGEFVRAKLEASKAEKKSLWDVGIDQQVLGAIEPEAVDLLLSQARAIHVSSQTVSVEAAEALIAHKGLIRFFGLKELSPALAAVMARFQGSLWIGGASDGACSDPHGVGLDDPSLTTISEGAAEALARFRGRRLQLDIEAVDERGARHLAQVDCPLVVWNADQWSHESVEVLVGEARSLALDFESLTEELTEILGAGGGDLTLPRLNGAATARLQELVANPRRLFLPSLKVDSDSWDVIAEHVDGFLSLRSTNVPSSGLLGLLRQRDSSISVASFGWINSSLRTAEPPLIGGMNTPLLVIGDGELSVNATEWLAKAWDGSTDFAGRVVVSDAAARFIADNAQTKPTCYFHRLKEFSPDLTVERAELMDLTSYTDPEPTFIRAMPVHIGGGFWEISFVFQQMSVEAAEAIARLDSGDFDCLFLRFVQPPSEEALRVLLFTGLPERSFMILWFSEEPSEVLRGVMCEQGVCEHQFEYGVGQK